MDQRGHGTRKGLVGHADDTEIPTARRPVRRRLDYAGAYSPPDGSDWRTLAKAAEAAGSVLDLFKAMPKPAAQDAGNSTGPQATAGTGTALTAEDHLLGKAREVTWRREQLAADVDALDAEVVRQSRRQAAEALPQGARTVFETLTAPREAGFMAAAAARAGERVREASQALSLERQALGVDEYHALIETAPEQAMAALGSAARELAARMRGDGADDGQIETAQQALVSATQSDRVRGKLDSDPAAAQALLEQSHGIIPAERAQLAAMIEAEQLRMGVRREVDRWLVDDPSLGRNKDRLLALADLAGDGDEELTGVYRGAALSAWRGEQAQQATREAEAWAPVETLLASGQARSWTDLPTHRWAALKPWQQADFRARTEQGWTVDGEPVLIRAGLKEQDGYPAWGFSAPPRRPEQPRKSPRLPPRAVMEQQSEVMADELIGKSGNLDPKAQAHFDNRHAARLTLLQSPEARAFMNVIAWAEGNVTYNSLAGDRQGKSYARGLSAGHPGRISGRYQIGPGTWGDFGEKKLGLTDYSDHSQDLAAVQIMKDEKILDALETGQIKLASDLAAERWASFRKAGTEHSKFTYNGKWQPTKTRDEVVARYEIELAKEKAKDAARAAAKRDGP